MIYEPFDPVKVTLANVPRQEGDKQFIFILFMLLEATIGAVMEWIVAKCLDDHFSAKVKKHNYLDRKTLFKICTQMAEKECQKNSIYLPYLDTAISLAYQALLKTASRVTDEQIQLFIRGKDSSVTTNTI